VSDFGCDAYALDDAEPVEQPHPLEIARDLIARGKHQAALEMLSPHHDQLADDPEYLLLCSEAWRADGDELRAQQALLGAARLAPEDPRPLLWLSELLAERGEQDRAQLVLDKARGLQAAAAGAEEPLEAMAPETEDDLIAFAEHQERRSQAAFTPRQVLFIVIALGVVGLLIAGIASLTSTDDEAPVAATAPTENETPPIAREASAADPIAIEAAEDELLREPLPEPEVDPAPPIVRPAATSEVPEVKSPEAPSEETVASVAPPPAPAVKAKAKSKAKPKVKPPAAVQPKAPDAAVVGHELESFDAAALTLRGDALYAQGHSGVAAGYYRRALELDPDYAPALVGMGQSILRAKKYSDAMRNASRALQLARGVDARPGLEAAAIYQMGRVHYERGERDAARRLFRQSISLPGTPPAAWFYLGEALSSDNSPAAREAYEKYLELVSDGHLAERARRAIQ
jgi:tetratricopeptide (TPR) repeat protein